jgi:hypothetical protein
MDVVAMTGADPRKNTERLLAAWARVPGVVRRGRRLLVLASVGPEVTQRWRECAVETGCGGNVEFVPTPPDDVVVRALQAAALVVQPSLEEGFGLPVAEAAACGAPVICSRTSAMPEVLDEPAATFDPYDVDDLARAIARALTDERHRSVLRAASSRAAARWRWPRVANELLDGLAAARRPSRRGAAISNRVALVASLGPAALDLAEALRAAVDGEVAVFVTPRPTVEVAPGVGDQWPAASLGPYAKYHDFDHVVVVVDVTMSAVARRVATQWPSHLWLPYGPVDDDLVDRARSVIVATVEHGERLAATAAGPPVLVLPSPRCGWTGQDIAVRLAWWLAIGHRRGDPLVVSGPTDTLP